MTLQPGRQLAHYRLVDQVGEGGMGVVWRATDSTLGREVALKVLPAEFAADGERLARFEREARLLASLNHPHIATIHGLHEDGGVRFLVMELVPGEDLATRVARGPLPIDEALGFARQIAEALRAAHAAGVIHRDLKPANIRILPDGQVRVLDFGLAKALEPGAVEGTGGSHGSGPSDPIAPTRTSTGSVAGTMLGTAAYMAPEQARGRPVDRRADVWSFGCVLYEMLVGRGPFAGETISDTLAAILRGDPDWSLLPAGTPAPIRRLLRRCLQKDVERRLSDIADARLEIEDALDPSGEAAELAAAGVAEAHGATAAPTRLTGILAVVAGALAIALALSMVFRGDGASPSVPERAYLSITVPSHLTLVPGGVGGRRVGVSRDGRRVAFTALDDDAARLYLRSIDAPELIEVPGTRGASSPFFSPDGRWVAFFSAGRLSKVSVSGGTPIKIAEANAGRGGVWLDDDTIVYAPAFNSGLWRVSAAGGTPRVVTEPDRDANVRTHRWPARLPGDRAVLATLQTQDSPGFYEDAIIVAVGLDDGTITTLVEGARSAFYAAGHLIYQRAEDLLAVPFDADALKITGAPVTLTERVGGEATSGAVDLAFTDTGAMVFIPLTQGEQVPQLVRSDRQGRAEVLPFEGRGVLTPSVSPNGKQLAVTVGQGAGDGEVWIYDLPTLRSTRLTFHRSAAQPIWSPDGSKIAYAYTGGGEEGVRLHPVDGSAPAETLLRWEGSSVLFPDDWREDGTFIFSNYGGPSGIDLRTGKLGEPDVQVLLTGDEAIGSAQFSPDGKWFAYVSAESGRSEVYVQPFPGPGGRFQVSTGGGKGPLWTRDGTELLFSSGDRLMVVPVTLEPTFSSGAPRELFRAEFRRELGPWRDYDISPDGKTIYFFRVAPGTLRPRQIDVRFDFPAALRPDA